MKTGFQYAGAGRSAGTSASIRARRSGAGLLSFLLITLACTFAAFYLTQCRQEGMVLPKEAQSNETGLTTDREYGLVCKALQSIPAPVEAANTLKKYDRIFHSPILHNPDNASLYMTGARKALNLGIYGADMAYANLYHEHYRAARYLNTVNTLCGQLQVDDQINFDALRRLTTSAGNLDSLISQMNLSMGLVSVKMQERGQLSLSLMMATGGWLEGMYLLTHSAQKTKNAGLCQKVGEQQVVLGQLVALLARMQQDSEHQEVYDAMKAIQRTFEGVTIREVYTGESHIEEHDGIATFVDTRQTEVVIEPERLQLIAQAVGEARRMATRHI